MLNCDWTEKVSLLVDGELTATEAAAVEAHLGGCEECRAARGEFLFFRQQLGSFQAEVNPSAQRRALAAILASKSAPSSRGEDAARSGGGFAPAPGWRERLAAALGVAGLRPAAAASLAVVVLAGAVGFALYVSSRDEARTLVQSPPADAAGERAAAKPPPAATTPEAPKPEPEGQLTGGGAPVSVATAAAGNRPPSEKRRARHETPRRPNAGGSQTIAARAPAGESPAPTRPAGVESVAVAPAAPREERAEVSRAPLDTSRHVEQAQLLLRSFRNARGGDDLAYERERSQRLLYRNIVLRREAASKGDPVVAGVLGRLEPILLDIANLPDNPASEDVDSIRERVRKKNLVVALQAGRVNASSQ